MLNLDNVDELRLYLDDHWAGAGAGAALARSLAGHNRSTSWSAHLRAVVDDIEADEATLADVRAQLGADGGGFKRLLARVGDRVRVVKPNGRVFGYSPLSRIIEVEALIAGVAGKECLWATLRSGLPEGTLHSVDLPELQHRAEDQLKRLGSFHDWAAAEAFRPH